MSGESPGPDVAVFLGAAESWRCAGCGTFWVSQYGSAEARPAACPGCGTKRAPPEVIGQVAAVHFKNKVITITGVKDA